MKSKPITLLLVLVAALLGGIVIVQTSRPAEAGTVGGTATGAGDGTCPSDVNGDLVVNVLDLIDLLLDFGAECPGSHVVDVANMPVLINCNGGATISGTLALRVWSGGLVEYVTQGNPNLFPQEWEAVNAPTPTENARPVAIAMHGAAHCNQVGGAATSPRAVLQWSDGTLRSTEVNLSYIPVKNEATVSIGSFSADFP